MGQASGGACARAVTGTGLPSVMGQPPAGDAWLRAVPQHARPNAAAKSPVGLRSSFYVDAVAPMVLSGMSVLSGAHGIRRPLEPRAAGGHIAVAGPRLIGAHPEGVQPAARQGKTEAHRLVCQLTQIGDAFPLNGLPRAVRAHGDAV